MSVEGIDGAGILVVGHGSRAVHANAAFEGFVASVRARVGDETSVERGYLELASPLLTDALMHAIDRDPHRPWVLAPYLLGNAGHMKRDVMGARQSVLARWPQARIGVASPLGAHPLLAEIAADRARAVLGATMPCDADLLLIARGASDDEAVAGALALAAQVRALVGFANAHVGFLAAARPGVDEALAQCRAATVIVVPYLLAAGQLSAELHSRWLPEAALRTQQALRLADVLAPDDRLVTALLALASAANFSPGTLER